MERQSKQIVPQDLQREYTLADMIAERCAMILDLNQQLIEAKKKEDAAASQIEGLMKRIAELEGKSAT